jgi:hypothetical protein
MLLLTSTLVLSALLRAPTSGLAVLESPHRHVRAETSAAHRALRDGYRRSVTFAASSIDCSAPTLSSTSIW